MRKHKLPLSVLVLAAPFAVTAGERAACRARSTWSHCKPRPPRFEWRGRGLLEALVLWAVSVAALGKLIWLLGVDMRRMAIRLCPGQEQSYEGRVRLARKRSHARVGLNQSGRFILRRNAL